MSPWSRAHGWRKPYFDLLTPEQARAINQFLHFYAMYGEDFDQRDAQQSLDNFWGKFD